MNVTKTSLTTDKIKELTQLAFPGCEFLSSLEVTEGMCNTIYIIEYIAPNSSMIQKNVLKIAAPERHGLLRNEPCLLKTEVTAMELSKRKLTGDSFVPIPQIQYYCTDKSFCGAEFLFMEYIEGISMGKLRSTLSNEEKKYFYTEIGKIVKYISSIKNDTFGYLGSGIEFTSFYEFIYHLFDNVLLDAEDINVDLTVPYDAVRQLVKKEKDIFDEIQIPSLVHFDIWENNIMLKDGKISGVLDWERAIFGDPLMEERFREYCKNTDFYCGYGLLCPTESESRRMWFYDLWMAATWMTETFFREYETDKQYHWAKTLFRSAWNKLNNIQETDGTE